MQLEIPADNIFTVSEFTYARSMSRRSVKARNIKQKGNQPTSLFVKKMEKVKI